jgi:hypothetical protein
MYLNIPWRYAQIFASIAMVAVLLGDFFENNTHNFYDFLGVVNGSLMLICIYLVSILRKCNTIFWNKPHYFKVFALSKFQFYFYELRQVFLFRNFILLLLVLIAYVSTRYGWLSSLEFSHFFLLSIIYIGNILFIITILIFTKSLCKGDINSDKNNIILSIVPFFLLLCTFSEQMEKKGDVFSLFLLHYNPFSNIFYWGLQDMNNIAWYIALYPFIGIGFVFLCAKLFLKQWI